MVGNDHFLIRVNDKDCVGQSGPGAGLSEAMILFGGRCVNGKRERGIQQ